MIELTEDDINVMSFHKIDGKDSHLSIYENQSIDRKDAVKLKQQILKWQEDSKKLEEIKVEFKDLEKVRGYIFSSLFSKKLKKILNEDSENN